MRAAPLTSRSGRPRTRGSRVGEAGGPAPELLGVGDAGGPAPGHLPPPGARLCSCSRIWGVRGNWGVLGLAWGVGSCALRRGGSAGAAPRAPSCRACSPACCLLCLEWRGLSQGPVTPRDPCRPTTLSLKSPGISVVLLCPAYGPTDRSTRPGLLRVISLLPPPTFPRVTEMHMKQGAHVTTAPFAEALGLPGTFRGLGRSLSETALGGRWGAGCSAVTGLFRASSQEEWEHFLLDGL